MAKGVKGLLGGEVAKPKKSKRIRAMRIERVRKLEKMINDPSSIPKTYNKKPKTEEDLLTEQILKWRRDPLSFVKEAIGVKRVDPQQEAVLNALPQHKFIAVKSGHGVGKSTTEAWVILWFLTCYPNSRIGVTAPTEDQLTKILWPEISKWLDNSDLKGLVEWSKSKVWVKGEEETAFAIYRTASKPEALQGLHADNMLFILEEASGIDDVIWEPVEGALTSMNSRAIAMGNPTRPVGNFYRAFTDQAGFWKTFTFSSKNSTLVSPEYVERMKQKYGENSDIYRVRVLGEFPSQNSNSFIPLWLCEQSFAYEIPHTPILRMGVDIARFGDDYTVWLIRGGGKIIHIEKAQTLDTMEIAGRTQALAKKYSIHPSAVFIDEIGVGGGVIDRLNELDFGCQSVNVSEKATDEETYKNKRAEIWGNVKVALQDKELSLKVEDDDEIGYELAGELTSPLYKFTSNGQYQLEAKEEMKQRGVGSPDIADALALTYYDSDSNFVVRTAGKVNYPQNT